MSVSDTAMIHKLDLPLYIDVTCYGCKRLVALSNCETLDGRNYCPRCSGNAIGTEGIAAFERDFEPVSSIRID
jgi:hypothetical protein